jgi:ribosomal protein S18 acetylase RimI-like enzyme
MPVNHADVRFQEADAAIRSSLVAKLNVPGRHRLSERTVHLGDDGFTIVAMSGSSPIGVISVCWKKLPAPHSDTREAYIDLIDVDPEYRRQSIGRRLVEIARTRAVEAGVYQIRAWTSESSERTVALAMWRALGFAICPTEILTGPQPTQVRGWFVAQRLDGQ